MPRENVKLVQRLIAANRSGPPQETTEIALSLVDPALEFRSRITAVEGATYLGHEGVRRYFDDLADAFRDWRNEPDEIVAVGPDAVIAINTFRAVARERSIPFRLILSKRRGHRDMSTAPLPTTSRGP